MKKIIFSALILTSFLVSCNDTDDLDKRLDKLEKATGTDQPMKFSFSTTNYEDVAITENGPYLISNGLYSGYMYDYGDGQYYFQIVKYAGLEMNERLYISFDYNSNDKSVDDVSIDLQFIDRINGYYYSPEFESDNGPDQTLTLTVKSFDPSTGKIDFSFEAASTASYGDNIFEGEPMTLSKGSFKGTLRPNND